MKIKSAIIDDEDVENYISMIIPKRHPEYEQIVSLFDSEIQYFFQMK